MIIRRLFPNGRALLLTKCLSSVPSSSSATNDDHSHLLRRFIRDKICASGPLSVAEYMQICISSPVGYYARQAEIFGEKGDFVTAPELSQIFGELIGAWVLHELQMTGHTGQWQLVELGPGTGTLMADIIGVLKRFEALSNLSIHLVEKSEHLKQRQRMAILERISDKECTVEWHADVEDIPHGFTIFISNEFFDALPVHQFRRCEDKSGKWREICVGLNSEGKFCFLFSPGENVNTKLLIPGHIRRDTARTHWEYSPLTAKIAFQMVQRFTADGGFALILDYGHNGTRPTHSLRAYRDHKLVEDPLECPGQVDLTADVDFGQMARTLREKCLVYGPVEQKQFLSELGFAHRMEYLMSKCENKGQRKSLLDACRILLSKDEMGARFKALGLFPSTLEDIHRGRGGAPAGFASTLEDTNEGECR